MAILREHSDSILAVLEAFVHDPLLNWRLNDEEDSRTDQSSDDSPRPRYRSHSFSSSSYYDDGEDDDAEMNVRALEVIKRVKAKLSGRDFPTKEPLSVPLQVERLIQEATSNENLSKCYVGWCPFW